MTFPFSALATAAYTNTEIKFEDTGKNLVLQGASATSELEIVSILAETRAQDPKVHLLSF